MVKEPIKRLEEKILKENLWLFLFKLLHEGDRYAYELRRAVNSKFGFWAGKVTGYKVLYLLEKDGYVRSYMKRRKKYYELTEKGLEQLRKAKDFLEKVCRSL